MDSALSSASFCSEQDTWLLHGVAAHVANLTTARTSRTRFGARRPQSTLCPAGWHAVCRMTSRERES